MKTALIFGFLTVLGLSAHGKTYLRPHAIGMVYENAETCKAEGGYAYEDGLCFFEAADSVSITEKGSFFTVQVETISHNAHMCSYEANNGVMASSTQLISSQPTEKWVDGNFVPATCVVTVNYLNDGSVSVSTNGYEECREFCGQAVSLDIENAKEAPAHN